MAEEVVSKEVAQQEFDNFCEAMDIDNDTEDFDSETLASFNKHRKRIVKVIMSGHLTFTSNYEPVYQQRKDPDAEPITFYERTGDTLTEASRLKNGTEIQKMYVALAHLTRGKCHSKRFNQMPGIDIKVCESLFALLMD